MAFPEEVTTRQVRVPGAVENPSAAGLRMEVYVTPSLNLTWTGGGEATQVRARKFAFGGNAGEPVLVPLIPTDLSGWRKDDGSLIVVGAGQYSHTYDLTFKFFSGEKELAALARDVKGLVVPSGEDPVDLADLLEVASSEGGTVLIPDVWTQIVTDAEAAAQAAADAVIDSATFVDGRVRRGQANGTASLDSSSKVPAAQLPFGASDFATAAQGSKADTAVQDTPAGRLALAESTEVSAAIGEQITAAGVIATKDAIVGVGHSMMEDTGSTTGGWVKDMAAEFGVPGTNLGTSGETSTGVALRWSIPVYVTFPENTVPASTSPVAVTVTPASSWRDFGYGGGLYAADGSLIATGSLSHASGAFTFARSTAGSAVAVPGPVEFRPTAANTHLGDIAVIWAGVNNSAGSPGRLMDYLPDLHALVDSLSTDRYVIIGDLPTTTQPKGSAQYTALSALWDAIENDFGKAKFIRLNEALVSYGLDIAGINPTATDRANITSSVAPNSLRSDGFHPSQTGYAVVRKIVGQRIRQLGYLPQGGRPIDAPAQPTGLAAGTATTTTVPLSCSTVSGALGYRFNYRIAGATSWTLGAISATPAATIEGLTPGTNYEFQVVAVNAAGPGSASATVAAATSGVAPVLVFSDSFNRADGALSGSTADGALGGSGFTWGSFSTEARIVSNQVGRTSGSTVRVALGPSSGQVGMRVTSKVAVRSSYGIFIGNAAGTDGVYVNINSAGALALQRVGTAAGPIGSSTADGTVQDGDDVTIAQSSDGMTITLLVNGVQVYSYTLASSPLTGTYAHLRIGGSTTGRFDDFRVYTG